MVTGSGSRCGCDAAPYLEYSIPTEQTKKFDAALIYIKKMDQGFLILTTYNPIVEHAFAEKASPLRSTKRPWRKRKNKELNGSAVSHHTGFYLTRFCLLAQMKLPAGRQGKRQPSH
jgi:hypothetical protein